MGHTGFGSMDFCATELLNGDILTGNGFYYLRTGDEHIRVLLGHHDEVGQSRAIYCSTRARTEDYRDLRHYAGSQNITLENLCISRECASTFLDTRATRVIETDDRRTEFHSLIHDIANLLRHGLRERTADYRCVLRKDKDQTAVDSTRTNSYAIAQEHFLLHAEIMAAVGKEHIHFLKRALVEQHVDALTSGVATLGMVFLYSCFTASGHGLLAVLNQFI